VDLHDTGATFMPLEAGHRLGPRNSTRFDEGTVENPSKIETPFSNAMELEMELDEMDFEEFWSYGLGLSAIGLASLSYQRSAPRPM